MTASKAYAAVLAFAIALPVSALAAPAFASTSNNSIKSYSVPATFATEDNEDHKASGEDSESDHKENHHQIPPVIIRPKDDGEKAGHKNESEDSNENDSEDGDDDSAGFVVPGPGPIPSPAPSDSASPSAGSTNSGGIDGSNTGTTQIMQYNVSPVGGVAQDLSIEPAEANAGALNPEAAPPVNLAGIEVTAKTPADVFMESATIALTALAIGAVAMGGVASTRALRLRRNPKGDYFYDGEK